MITPYQGEQLSLFRTPALEMNSSDLPNSALPNTGDKIPHSRKPHRSRWQRVELYSSHGSKYFRFRWGKGRETWGYLHIPGGDISTAIVQERKKAIDQAIKDKKTPDQIKKMMLGWSEAKRGRKPF